YAVLLPFDSITGVGPGGQTLTRIVGAAAATILLGTALLRKDYKRPPPQALWWALFVTWAGVTVLWALEWQPATSKLLTAVSLLLLYVVVLTTGISHKELRTISLFAVAGGCAAAAYTTFQFYHGTTLYSGSLRGSMIAGDRVA